jgi:hypothetical protein
MCRSLEYAKFFIFAVTVIRQTGDMYELYGPISQESLPMSLTAYKYTREHK